jgi:hypothetical protein
MLPTYLDQFFVFFLCVMAQMTDQSGLLAYADQPYAAMQDAPEVIVQETNFLAGTQRNMELGHSAGPEEMQVFSTAEFFMDPTFWAFNAACCVGWLGLTSRIHHIEVTNDHADVYTNCCPTCLPQHFDLHEGNMAVATSQCCGLISFVNLYYDCLGCTQQSAFWGFEGDANRVVVNAINSVVSRNIAIADVTTRQPGRSGII